MLVNQKTSTCLFISCLAISVFALSGCRSGGFTKPDMSKLAFWKSENSIFASKTTPPPPARHFDPAPIGGEEAPSEIVDLDKEKLRKRFDNDIDEMREEINAAVKAMGDPIRKPYSSEVAQEGTDSDNSFSAQSNQVKSKLEGLKTPATAGLNAAQNDFQAAMNNASKAYTNDFSGSTTSADAKSGWKEDIALPTGISQGKNGFDQSLAAVNKALGNANGKLASELKTGASSINEKVAELKNTFQPNIDVAGKLNDFQAPTQNKLTGFVQPENGFARNQNVTPMTTQPNSELESAQAQVIEAKRQIDELKQQIARANRQIASPSTSQQPNNFPPNNANFPTTQTAPERTAQLQAPGFNSNYTASVKQQPANVLRSTNQPLQPSSSQPLSPQSNTAPGYSSTPHGGFTPRVSSNDFNGNFAPQASASAQVDFQSFSDDSMVVTADAGPASTSGFAGELKDHVSEVDIPDSILRGSSSYAPGSVQPLQAK